MVNIFSKQGSSTIELLKWIAIISMIFDHIGYLLYPDIDIFRHIGRISLPLFGFILIHNYFYFSKNKIGYIKRLFLFSMVSQPVFWIVIEHKLNIFFLLALTLSLIYSFEYINKLDRENIEKYVSMSFIFLFSLIPTLWIDYGPLGYLFLLSIALSFKSFKFIPLNIFFTFFLNSLKYSFSGLLYIPVIYISTYINTNIKRVNKWFFYLFYPVHLLFIYLIKIYIF